MDRIDRIGPRDPTWFQPAIDPDREDVGERRRREEERRRRARDQHSPEETREGRDGDDPPHHIDVRA